MLSRFMPVGCGMLGRCLFLRCSLFLPVVGLSVTPFSCCGYVDILKFVYGMVGSWRCIVLREGIS